MILSNVSIQEALDRGWLAIDPEPAPRQPSSDADCPYNTSSVDLRLGKEIIRLDRKLPIVIDLRTNSFAALANASAAAFHLTEEQPFELQPQQFVLGRTLEKICLPISTGEAPCLAARIL